MYVPQKARIPIKKTFHKFLIFPEKPIKNDPNFVLLDLEMRTLAQGKGDTAEGAEEPD